MWTCIATTSVDLQLWKDNAGRGSFMNHNAVMRSYTGSVARDPSNLWPVCRALWHHLMCPWPFGKSKWTVKLHAAKQQLEPCGCMSLSVRLCQ